MADLETATKLALAYFRKALTTLTKEDRPDLAETAELEDDIKALAEQEFEACPDQADEELAMFAVEAAIEQSWPNLGGGWSYEGKTPRYDFSNH
jgi:hypothetical protein